MLINKYSKQWECQNSPCIFYEMCDIIFELDNKLYIIYTAIFAVIFDL